jgi:hypothetical protein
MCLIIKDAKFGLPQKSKQNRVCYKVIRVQKMHGDKMRYTTPFRNTKLDHEILNGVKPFVANNQKRKWTSLVKMMGTLWLSYPAIGSGYIHAYYSLGAAKRACANLHDNSLVVYRCEIPAGTEYFEGEDNDICARQIVFDKMVYSFINEQ